MDYKKTLNLPKTDFPMRAGLPALEPKILQRWKDQDIYGQLMERGKQADENPHFLTAILPEIHSNLTTIQGLEKHISVVNQECEVYEDVRIYEIMAADNRHCET